MAVSGKNKARMIVYGCILLAVCGIMAFMLASVGLFYLGSELGSGNPRVYVFLTADHDLFDAQELQNELEELPSVRVTYYTDAETAKQEFLSLNLSDQVNDVVENSDNIPASIEIYVRSAEEVPVVIDYVDSLKDEYTFIDEVRTEASSFN